MIKININGEVSVRDRLYGSMQNGYFAFAPFVLFLDGQWYQNPTDEQYRAAGYKPVREAEQPVQEGFQAVPDYEELEDEILQSWHLEPIPEPEATPEDFMDALAALGVAYDEENA